MSGEKRIIKPITEEGANRLVGAILDQTLQDWDNNIHLLHNARKRDLALYELKQIINFIMSDWYIYLTEANSPQETIVYGLLNRLKIKRYQDELTQYFINKYHHHLSHIKESHHEARR